MRYSEENEDIVRYSEENIVRRAERENYEGNS